MNLRLSPFLLLFFFFSLPFAQAQSKVSKLVDANRDKIQPPYIYDGFAMTEFTMDSTLRVMHAQFSALKGQQYRLYVCTSAKEDTIGVTVFDAGKAEKGQRENIFGSKIINGETLSFDLARPGTYTVEYAIPTCENAEYGATKDECIVLLISYRKK